MSRFPLPPNHNPATTVESEPVKALTTISQDKLPDKKMNRDETAFLLDRHLLFQHRTDPNIMKFIASFLICRNVKQAANEAGITTRDGENLRRRPDIHEAIKQITDRAILKHGYDAADVVERVKEITNIDPVDFENADGTFKESLSQIPAESRRAIKSFKAKNIYGTDPNGMRTVIGKMIEVQFWDKMKAVELLGREKDLFKETKVHQHDVTRTMADTLLESKQRGEQHVAEFRDVGENE